MVLHPPRRPIGFESAVHCLRVANLARSDTGVNYYHTC